MKNLNLDRCLRFAVVGLLAALLIAVLYRPTKPEGASPEKPVPVLQPGEVVKKEQVPNLPPPPIAVANSDRIRQNLKPGRTYETNTLGTVVARGEDKDWGFRTVVTINYAFQAQIDREIEQNDGKTIVELRHFRDIRSLKVNCVLEDVRIDLAGLRPMLRALDVLPGELQALDGVSLRAAIGLMRRAGLQPEQFLNTTKAFAAVDRLSGKSVRITYRDGEGVVQLEAVKGEMTAQERDFHMASVLLSDSLIVPDVDVKIGNRWEVDGRNFANMIDPSLMARVGGEVLLEREKDQLINGKNCLRVNTVSGRLRFDDSDAKVGKVGHFDPKGAIFFSPEEQIIVEAKLSGTAVLEKFSKNHLLFEARFRTTPELDILYTCRIK